MVFAEDFPRVFGFFPPCCWLKRNVLVVLEVLLRRSEGGEVRGLFVPVLVLDRVGGLIICMDIDSVAAAAAGLGARPGPLPM